MLNMDTPYAEAGCGTKPGDHAAPDIEEMLLQQELIIQHDLDFALEHQKHSNEPLGEILVRMGAIDREALEKAIAARQSAVYFV